MPISPMRVLDRVVGRVESERDPEIAPTDRVAIDQVRRRRRKGRLRALGQDPGAAIVQNSVAADERSERAGQLNACPGVVLDVIADDHAVVYPSGVADITEPEADA